MAKHPWFGVTAFLIAHVFLLLRPASGAEKPEPIAAWKSAVDEVFDDMRRTIRRRDQLAFEERFRALIEKGAEPEDEFRKELGLRLRITPPGVAMNALAKRLIEGGSPEAVKAVFEALSEPVFQDLKGQELGEKETDSRRRILESYLIRLGDKAWAARNSDSPPREPPLKLSEALEDRLIQELEAKEEKRVRCAAYLLGGAGAKKALDGLVKTAERLESSPLTKAVVVEAIARVDPQGGAQAIEAAAASKQEQVELAGLPGLGYLKSKTSEDLIKQALESQKWVFRRAAVEACRNRRDTFGMDLLMGRYPKEVPRLQYDILQAVIDITGGLVPPDPKEWSKWWRVARAGFKAPEKTKPKEESKAESKGKTIAVPLAQPRYFGVEVWSSQLAILLDISGSMNSSNLNLGTSGVAVAGALKEGAPIAVAKDQIQRLLKSLPSRASFNIIAYNQRVQALQERLLPATKQNIVGAVKFVDGLKADGGTNIHDSLIMALKEQNVDTIYLVSDGEPTDGQRTQPDDILEAVQMLNRFRKTRINTIQLGQDQELMRELAESSGGKYKLLEVGEDAPKKGKGEPLH